MLMKRQMFILRQKSSIVLLLNVCTININEKTIIK